MSDLIKVIIPRNRWDRGPRSTGAYLVREIDREGKICGCVLGHVGVALGIDPQALLEEAYPLPNHDQWPTALFGEGKYMSTNGGFEAFCHDIAATNDRSYDNEAQREQALIAELAEVGVELEFIDVG